MFFALGKMRDCRDPANNDNVRSSEHSSLSGLAVTVPVARFSLAPFSRIYLGRPSQVAQCPRDGLVHYAVLLAVTLQKLERVGHACRQLVSCTLGYLLATLAFARMLPDRYVLLLVVDE